jgi:hypothetical protein
LFVLFAIFFGGSMEEELARKWGNLALNEEENEGISVASEELDYMIGRGSLCLIGKVLVDRFVPKDSIRGPLMRAWNPAGEVSFKVIGGNMILNWQRIRVESWRGDLGWWMVLWFPCWNLTV